MKTRFGYVSNSSSSSFILYGVPTESVEDIESWLEEEGTKIICVAEDQGSSGDVADFVFTLTKPRYFLLKKCMGRLLSDSSFHVIREMYQNDDDAVVVQMPELKNGHIFRFDRDDKSPSSDNLEDPMFLRWASWWLEE